MAAAVNRRIILRSRPVGMPGAECYELRESPIPKPAENQLLVRNLYASLDPAIRGWMDDKPSYIPPMPLGAPVRATTVAKVIESRASGFAPGDLIVSLNGWEDYSLVSPGGFTAKIPPDARLPITSFLSVLGAVGLTAYFGLLDVGQPQAGSTVLVSGAAGAVGSLVGQIARIHGCRAVGIAGGSAKCARIREECGFDAAIDYKGAAAANMGAAIREACPNGVDVYFDNVGGALLDEVLMLVNRHARVVLCGMIANYNDTTPGPGTRNLWQLLVKSARIEGFVVSNYLDRFPEGIAQMAQWVADGRIQYREHIDRGLENAPQSFQRLFTGNHSGKLILDIASEELRT